MIAFIITFLAVFITDIINAYYIKAIQEDKALIASLWATAVTFGASVAIISYTQDNLMLVAALLGAFFGTYVAIKYNKKD